MTDESTEYSLYKALCINKKVKISDCCPTKLQGLRDKKLPINQTEDHYEIEQQIIPLDSADIKKHLEQGIIGRISDLLIVYQVNSTNIAIHEYKYRQDYLVMLAESQQSGKGRRDKTWCSPLGSNIYVSIKFNHDFSEHASFIPLVTAVALCKTLTDLGVQGCMIKWPNDIYVYGKKIAGILIENRYNSITGNICVVGIGLNVNMKANNAIDQHWTSLVLEKNKLFNRNQIIAQILTAIINQYDQLDHFDITRFIHKWHNYDYLHGKSIHVHSDTMDFDAVANGLSRDGALKININGQNKIIYSADVSIRPGG